MAYGELYIPADRPTHNPLNGQFLKGNVPHNKGKKWGEYMTKRTMKRAAKGWVNLDKYRPKSRPENAERCGKKVIAVLDDGRFVFFQNITRAAEWIGGNRENVRRCIQMNESGKVCKRDWRPNQKKGSGRVNTDHRYLGVRFYLEKGELWMTKIQ